jgi:starvation-inducible DNA-binding protein
MSKAHEALTDHLRQILADTYVLAVKTHAAHWNVTGAQFFSLHAARLRALGGKAPAGLRALGKASKVEDIDGSDGLKLAKALHEDHAALSAALKKGIAAAEAADDGATADLLTGRLEEHDKTAWMLKATIA